MTDAAKLVARQWVDDHRVELSQWHRTTWVYAVCAGKVIAGALLDLLRDRQALADAREELDRRRAERDLAPLLPAGFTAPVDLPWPDRLEATR